MNLLLNKMKLVKRLAVLYFFTTLIGCSLAEQQTTEISDGKKLSSHFPKIESSFALYQQQVKRYLSQQSLPQRSDQQISYNLPFEWAAKKGVPYKGRFLLIHGLNDSPFVWRDFAKIMVNRGFDVRAILLEGHGSHPKNMLDVSAKKWIKSVQAHYDVWQQETPISQSPIYIGGFSLGGVLATNLAINNPEIAGLMLVSPAYHSKLNNLLSFSWVYKHFQPWLFGTMLNEDNPAKYNSISINAGSAYYSATQHLKQHWHKPLNMPVLMVHTVNDSVVDINYSRGVFRKKFKGEKALLLFSSSNENHAFPLRPSERLHNSYYPNKRILNQSHLSLINSADNPLLGEHSKVLICNGNEYEIFKACMRAEKHWYGAQHTQSPNSDAVARTTYNPDFATVVEAFDRVFATSNTQK